MAMNDGLTFVVQVPRLRPFRTTFTVWAAGSTVISTGLKPSSTTWPVASDVLPNMTSYCPAAPSNGAICASFSQIWPLTWRFLLSAPEPVRPMPTYEPSRKAGKMSAESVYAVAAPRNGTTASNVVTTPSAHSEKAMPSNGDGWMGVGSTSYGSIEANPNTHAPWAAARVLDWLPGHSTQNPPRLVPAKTERSLPLPLVGRARAGSA